MKIKVVKLIYDLEDDLPLSFGHKLRGYFANRFKDVLFHQHKEDGSLRYKYPLIQYKIINKKPVVLGLKEGAELIVENFLSIERLVLGDREYINPSSRLKVENEDIKVVTKYDMPNFKYTFISPWLGLSQSNYREYIQNVKGENKDRKINFLKGILTGNILSFAKGLDWWIEEKVIAVPSLKEIPVKFKGEEMIGFIGSFYSNVYLPEYIGLGKSSSRGFGTIKREEII